MATGESHNGNLHSMTNRVSPCCMGDMGRRCFIRVGAAFAAAPFLVGGDSSDGSARVMRIGVMTDTHVGKTVESCSRVRQALELFKSKGCDMVINNGDIADWHYPTGYQAYRQVSDEVYGSDYHPQEIFTYAWHDTYAYNGLSRSEWSKASVQMQAFADVQRILKAKNGPLAKILFRGYVFLVFPQFVGDRGYISFAEYEQMIASACAETPDRPVFVVDHIPPGETVYSSYMWGDKRRTRVLSKYPQVVHLSGHVHGSLRNDLFIWQKEFTAINSGCLQVWRGDVSSDTEPAKKEYGVLTIDVFPNRLLVRRWDVRDGTEICAKSPWNVPLPFVAATAPYRLDSRKALAKPPLFAADASITVKCDGDPLKRLVVGFPEAGGDVMKYRVDFMTRRHGEWGCLSCKEVISEFWKRAQDRTGIVETYFRPEILEDGQTYRIMVTPISQYCLEGACIESESSTMSANLPAMKLVWESLNPMEDLKLMHLAVPCNAKTPSYPHQCADDGWYEKIGNAGARFELPKGVFSGRPGDVFVVVIDAECRQPLEGDMLSFSVIDPVTSTRISPRCGTFRGRSGFLRYVVVAQQPKDKVFPDAHIAVEMCGVEKRFRVERIRVLSKSGVR